MSETVRNVVILGSGCSGLTAAIYAARANLKPLVIEGHEPGGQLSLTTLVENFPGFPEGIQGPELIETRTLIIASGASARWLNLPSEQALIGHGVSSCATCDGFFFSGKEITVIGGGDSAMEEALFLTRFGTKVTIIHRSDKYRASKIMLERAQQHPKIQFLSNTIVEEVYDATKKEVTGLKLKDLKNNRLYDFKTDAMFLGIGHIPNAAWAKPYLDLDADGYIIPKNFVHTKVPGVFASGDVSDRRYRQAITAAGTGCMAALEVEKYLEMQGH
jgi:thioredoxin reductase (NADPH)